MNVAMNNPVNVFDTISLDDLIYHDAQAELENTEVQAYALFEKAVSDIKIIRKEYICVYASSFGKDSTLTLLAGLQAHLELISEGELDQDAPFIVTTIDTKVENHLMSMLVKHEIARLKSFATRNNINIVVKVASPNMSRQWASH